MSDESFIHGIAIGGYRSFGSVQRLYPLRQINLLAGANNCGKSNILRLLYSHLPRILTREPSKHAVHELDAPVHGDHRFTLGFARPVDDEHFANASAPLHPPEKSWLRRILEHSELNKNTSVVWFDRSSPTISGELEPDYAAIAATLRENLGLNRNQYWRIFHQLFPQMSGGDEDNWIVHLLKALDVWPAKPPLVSFVPAVRRIGDPIEARQSQEETEYDFSGDRRAFRIFAASPTSRAVFPNWVES